MARLVNKFLDFIGVEEHDDEEYDDYPPQKQSRNNREPEGKGEYDQEYERNRYVERSERTAYTPRNRNIEPEPLDRSRKRGGKVVNHPSAVETTQHHMTIYQMEDYDDARTVIDDLLNDRSVLINLELVDVDVSQRIVDMLSGATYAMGASLKKAAANTYLLAPASVDVSGSYEDEERRTKSGSFFGNRR